MNETVDKSAVTQPCAEQTKNITTTLTERLASSVSADPRKSGVQTLNIEPMLF